MPLGGDGAIHVLNVAKAVAEILSREAMQSRAGRSRYNRVFEFSYAIGAQACHMLVTSVTGHLMELDFEDRYPKWYSCDPVQLFHLPVRKVVPQEKAPYVAKAEKLKAEYTKIDAYNNPQEARRRLATLAPTPPL